MSIYSDKEAKAFGRLWGKGIKGTDAIRKAAGKTLGLKTGVRKAKVSAWKAAVHPGKVPKMPFQAEVKHVYIKKYGGVKGTWKDAVKEVMQYPEFKKRRAARYKPRKDFEAKIGRSGAHDASKKRYSWTVSFTKVYKEGRSEEETARYSSNRRLSNAQVEKRVKKMFASSPYTVENVQVLDMSIDRGYDMKFGDYI